MNTAMVEVSTDFSGSIKKGGSQKQGVVQIQSKKISINFLSAGTLPLA